MAAPSWDDVDRYLCDLLVGHDRALEAALETSKEAGLPPIAVAPNQGKLLQLLARSIDARRVLEIGTLGGYSTIWLARSVGDGGAVVTLEVSPEHAVVAQGNLERAGVAGRVEIRVAPALESLERLEVEGVEPFDFVFIDADKENTRAYFERSLHLSRSGTLIVVDNVVRSGTVADPSLTDPRVQGMREFLDYVAGEKRVDVTAIQTVGSKGYDGFALALVL